MTAASSQQCGARPSRRDFLGASLASAGAATLAAFRRSYYTAFEELISLA